MPDFDYTPSSEDIAAIMRARTKDANGALGSFTDDTDPTRDQVEALILPATGMVAAAIGQDIPAEFQPAAKLAASAFTAMLVELTIQQKTGADETSAYEHYRALYIEAVERVTGAIPGEPGNATIRSVALTSPAAAAALLVDPDALP